MLVAPLASATYNHVECPEGSFLAGTDEIAYANAVVTANGQVNDASSAIGIDDNSYAYIFSTNPNSYLVLDMGEGEEVWDRFGLDFSIYNDNSREYWVKVYVSNDPNTGWQYVGRSDGKGEDRFSIAYTSYDSIRYVKIVNDAYNSRVAEIDAVRGYCISEPTDEEVPEFGTFFAAAILAGAGLFIYKRRSE